MRIESSNCMLASSRISVSTSTVREHLHEWDSRSDTTYDSLHTNGSMVRESTIKKDIAGPFTASQPDMKAQAMAAATPPRKETLQDIGDEFIKDVKTRIMKDIIETFTGKKMDVLDADDLDCNPSRHSSELQSDPTAGAQTENAGWGIDYQYHETVYTKEGIAFSASGAVRTADGRSMDFNVELEMSRETFQEIQLSLKAGDALKDPLMIDFSGRGVGFSEMKFEFDIDSDGVADRISVPEAGSGFIAYDKNGNGIIDNGSELFGPQSGNGFAEMAQLDSDNNGWIDENDPAFASLKIWRPSSEGNGRIDSLSSADVGAIYTGRAETKFNLQSGEGKLAAMIRESGVYLKESGGAGIVQEVDLVV